jgi:GNAT superfamily N-acetyltransferase
MCVSCYDGPKRDSLRILETWTLEDQSEEALNLKLRQIIRHSSMSPMRAAVGLLLAVPAAALFHAPIPAKRASQRSIRMRHRVAVRKEPWPDSEGQRSTYILAEINGDDEIGQCGVEVGLARLARLYTLMVPPKCLRPYCNHNLRLRLQVFPLSTAGLLNDEDGVRPRAMLSGTLWVDKNYRRQGVAQLLLREAESCARWWGYGELMLMVDKSNMVARRLYKKMGYTVAAESRYHGAQICMHRHLYSPTRHTIESLLPHLTFVD